MGEAHVFRRQRRVERAGEVVVAHAEVDLRDAVVRRHGRRERILQRLEPLKSQLRRVRRATERAAVREVGILRQVADRELLHRSAEVGEVAVVGHPVVVDRPDRVARKVVRVLPRNAFARVVELAVVGQVLEPELAGERTLQVAELVLQLVAALRHEHRGERGVVLRRDVPVVGNAELEAARAGLRVVGREQAAAAPVAERERGPGRSEDRGVEEAQPRVARRALLLLEIELDLARLDPPVLLPRPAGGVVRVGQAVALAAEELDALGGAARGAVALEQIARALERAGVVEDVVLQVRAEEAVGAALQAHAAVALGAPGLAVVAQGLAEDRHVVAPDLGVAARAHLEVAHAVDDVGFDHGALRVGIRGLARRARLCGLRGRRRRDGQRGREHCEAQRHGAGELFPWC